MKKTFLSTSFAIALSLTVGTVFADDNTGTINFNGLLTTTTCKVDIEGQGPNATITLPTVSTNALTQAGQVTGRTAFNMNLHDCENVIPTITIWRMNSDSSDVTHSLVSAFFEAGVTVDPVTGRLKNMDTSAIGATFVNLQLLDGSNNFAPIKVGSTSQVTNTSYVDIDSDTFSATLPYAVEYYATGTTTAGKVNSSVVYTLQYK
ncbi:TPA: type 1 fimbrial protein [Proteus mirabilis]